MTAKGGPLVTVIIPTHHHASTVDLTVRSVLAQSVTELDIVVIGDGASDAVVATLAQFADEPRIRFLPRPKSESRGEPTRHEVLTAAVSEYVCYVGDDDLLLPDHVEQMIELLADADFAHPLPVHLRPDGTATVHPTDLARRDCRDWHLHPRHNCVSLTGAAHRLSAYRRLPVGWQPAPPDRWSDHYMWQQWFTASEMRYRSGDRLTMLKFDAHDRSHMSPAQRRAELVEWQRRAASPAFEQELAALALDRFRRFAVDAQLTIASLRGAEAAAAALRGQLAQRQIALDAARTDLDRLRADHTRALTQRDRAVAARAAIRASRTWRMRERVMAAPGMRWMLSRGQRP